MRLPVTLGETCTFYYHLTSYQLYDGPRGLFADMGISWDRSIPLVPWDYQFGTSMVAEDVDGECATCLASSAYDRVPNVSSCPWSGGSLGNDNV